MFNFKNYRSRGVPDLGKGAKRTCKFDEVAKPKYGIHHYNHDAKFDLVHSKDPTLIPFDVKADFSKTVTSPRKLDSLDLEGEPEKEKIIMQKDGFPYEKYKQNFKKVHQDKIKNDKNAKIRVETEKKIASKLK